MIPRRAPASAALLLALAACARSVPGDPLLKPDALGPATLGDQLIRSDAATPPDRKPGECWARAVTPAIYETDTQHQLIRPAQAAANGRPAEPAEYQTIMRQRVIQDRQQVWFRTPCPTDLTPDFIGSLQRALYARDYYRGAFTGTMDAATRAALHRFQAQLGLDSDILALGTARLLGLVSYNFGQGAQAAATD